MRKKNRKERVQKVVKRVAAAVVDPDATTAVLEVGAEVSSQEISNHPIPDVTEHLEVTEEDGAMTDDGAAKPASTVVDVAVSVQMKQGDQSPVAHETTLVGLGIPILPPEKSVRVPKEAEKPMSISPDAHLPDVAKSIAVLLSADQVFVGKVTVSLMQDIDFMRSLQGVLGKDGKDGIPGVPGKDGADGKDGQPGRDGRDGLPGKAGQEGKHGSAGKQGPSGKDGTEGKSPTADEVAQAILYGVGGELPDSLVQAVQRVLVTNIAFRSAVKGDRGEPCEHGKDGTEGKQGQAGKDGSSPSTFVYVVAGVAIGLSLTSAIVTLVSFFATR